MKCPACGADTELSILPIGMAPTVYRCSPCARWGDYLFPASGSEAFRDVSKALAESRR